jgi:hypothetical protein
MFQPVIGPSAGEANTKYIYEGSIKMKEASFISVLPVLQALLFISLYIYIIQGGVSSQVYDYHFPPFFREEIAICFDEKNTYINPVSKMSSLLKQPYVVTTVL